MQIREYTRIFRKTNMGEERIKAIANLTKKGIRKGMNPQEAFDKAGEFDDWVQKGKSECWLKQVLVSKEGKTIIEGGEYLPDNTEK